MPRVKQKVWIYDRCGYKDCTTYRIKGVPRIFHFPSNDDSRKCWVERSGNTHLRTLKPGTLKNVGLCAKHFIPSDIGPNGRLRYGAMPIPFSVTQDAKDDSTVDSSNLVSTNVISSRMDLLDTPRETESSETVHSNERTKPEIIMETEETGERRKIHVTAPEPTRTYAGPSKVTFDESDDEAMTWMASSPQPVKTSMTDIPNKISGTRDSLSGDPSESATGRKRRKGISNRSRVKLEAELARYRQENKLLKVKLRRALTRKKSVEEFMDENGCTKAAAKAMIKLQLHRKNAPYADDEKDLAKQLYYYSATAYKRLLRAGCSFPAVSTVRGWIAETEVKPGFCPIIFEKLQEKLAQLPPIERICCLKWDEMSIKNYKEYSVKYDQIEGLVDLGSLGRRNERARYTFVFCLDSLNAQNSWRQFIAYFLTGNGMKASEIHKLLEECLTRLHEIGAKVVLTTCDQGSSNQSLYSSILGVTSASTLTFECAGQNYIASFDFPHLIKRLLATLRKHGKIYCNGNVIVSYDDFVDTWNYDCSNTTSRLLAHITPAHITPSNFEAMNVKRAFQMLSRRYAAAMRTAGDDPCGLKSTTWQESAAFAEQLNDVIDGCNAYRLYFHNPAKRPLSDRNPRIEQRLDEFVSWASNWKVDPKQNGRMKTIPCLVGLPLTVKAILTTYRSTKEEHPEFELAAALCNQDSVEHLFSKLRGRGGFNPNPTARMVRLSLRHILSTGYIGTTDVSNVQCPEASALLNPTSAVTIAFEKTADLCIDPIGLEEDDNNTDVITAASTIELFDREEQPGGDRSLYVNNAIVFFAGFIGHRILQKEPCDACQTDILKTPMDTSSPEEMYIEYREYENVDIDAPKVTKLKRPTELFAQIVGAQLEAFSDLCKKYWHLDGLVSKLASPIVLATAPMYSEWYDESHPCRDHRMQLLQFLVRVRVFAETKYNNRVSRTVRASTAQAKPNQKLRKLQGL